MLLDDDPDVNTPDNAGNAPLHWATFMWVSERNSYVYVDWLLAIQGIEVNSQNWAGTTALHQAAELNRVGVVDRLLKYPGIDARLLNDESETALSLAFKHNHDATIQRLLHHFGDRYFGWDNLEESKLLWDWASRLLHQSGKLVLFAEDTLTQTLQQSWNGWRKHFPERTRELEDFAKATGRVVAFTVSKAVDGTGYAARLTLGDSLTDGIIECAENTCQAIYENTTPEQRKALLSISVVIAGGPVGKIASRGARAFRKVPKGRMPKMGEGIVDHYNPPVGRRHKIGKTGKDKSPHRPQHVNNPYQPVQNIPTRINGRDFSGHALDQMRNRGLTPSVVENAIQIGNHYSGNRPGTTLINDAINNVKVVINQNGKIITVE